LASTAGYLIATQRVAAAVGYGWRKLFGVTDVLFVYCAVDIVRKLRHFYAPSYPMRLL